MDLIDVKALPCASKAIQHAIATFPHESIGLVVSERGRPVYVACKNVDPSPECNFTLAPEDLRAAEARGEVLAMIHSHPNGSPLPSEGDRTMCELSEVPWYVIAVHEDQGALEVKGISKIAPCGYRAPLIGRTFHHGILDCFTLIKDYYQEKLSITLPNFEREDDWWEKGQNLYLENFRSAGFEISPGDVREHDVFLMTIRSTVPNHAAIYIGNTQVLHHMYGRLSKPDVYGGYLREATNLILRHRSLK